MKSRTAFLFLWFALFLTNDILSQSVAVLESNLRKSTSRTEKMSLCFQLAEKLLNSNPLKAADYAHRASLLASELGEKRTEAEAIYLSAEGHLRRRDYTEASSRYVHAWNTARNYGLSDVVLKSMARLEEIAVKKDDLREALKWSRETVSYLKEQSGRSTSSSSALRRLDERRLELEKENQELREQLAMYSGKSEFLESSVQETRSELENYREIAKQTITQFEDTLTTIVREKFLIDSVARIKDRLVESLTKEQMADSIVRTQQERELAEQRQIAAEAKVARQKSENMRNMTILGAAFVLLLALLFYLRYLAKKRTANDLAEKNRQLDEERQKSDNLLLNILPPAVAGELKQYNKVAAKQYDRATVMFIDFTGFTKAAESLSPEALVKELDYCFSSFDQIISKYRIEKIKTVGDAYICASGLSDMNANPSDMIKAAIEIQDFLQAHKAQRIMQGLPFFEARVGIHFGPVVAGVVGSKKFAYDIWGDTVNIAARMEESCEPGYINVSEDAYWLAKYEFNWQHRGKLAAKNKGLLDMYYVVGTVQ